MRSHHPGLRFRPLRPDSLPRGRKGAAGRVLCVCRRRRILSLWPSRRGTIGRAGGAVDGETGCRPRARFGGHRLQHRVHPCAGALAAGLTVPFVGTVPAIKPACVASRSRRVSVLGTEATVQREYTRALIRDFGQGCDVTLVGSARLAGIAEAALHGLRSPMTPSRARSRRVLSRRTGGAPTPSCSPARTIRCCWSRSGASPRGRSIGSIRHPPSPVVLSACWDRRRRHPAASMPMRSSRRERRRRRCWRRPLPTLA